MSFKDNEIRNSKYIELLSTNNKLLIDQWKMQSGVQKEYDGQVKTYVFNVDGKSPLAQMYFPKDRKKKFDLLYPVLVLQLCFPIQARILFDIGVTCQDGQRKRVTLSTIQKSKNNSHLSTTLPYSIEHFNSWLHMLVDIEEIISSNWSNQILKGVDFVSLSGIFRVKRIFLLSREMIHVHKGNCIIRYDQLPKQLSLPPNVYQNVKYISSNETLQNEFIERTNLGTSPKAQHSSSSNISTTNTNVEKHILPKIENLALKVEKKIPAIRFLAKKSISQKNMESPEVNFDLSALSFVPESDVESSDFLSIEPCPLNENTD